MQDNCTNENIYPSRRIETTYTPKKSICHPYIPEEKSKSDATMIHSLDVIYWRLCKHWDEIVHIPHTVLISLRIFTLRFVGSSGATSAAATVRAHLYRKHPLEPLACTPTLHQIQPCPCPGVLVFLCRWRLLRKVRTTQCESPDHSIPSAKSLMHVLRVCAYRVPIDATLPVQVVSHCPYLLQYVYAVSHNSN